ncbi:MAG: peptide MFS transporter [Verrucomicrobia bacterium]|nr:peptide MFS transporter [Verrucomicrobiota bacterium]
MWGHPKGLQTLFFTELWERLSYYGMRALLVLFLVDTARGGFGMSTETAGAIYGLYTASVYLAALPGGWIADRILGQKQTVFVGGCVIAAGHFSMAIPTVPTFYLGLILIVIGTGLLKPNVSALVGDLYPEGGGRRDAGFSIYYMGINLGAFIGPLICGYLGQKIDWHLGFGTAGVGMVLGLIQYRLGWGRLPDRTALDQARLSRRKEAVGRFWSAVTAGALVLTLVAALHLSGVMTVRLAAAAKALGVGILGLALVYFVVVLAFGKWTREEKWRIVVILFLFIGSAVFWSGFEQAGSSMNLFAERLTDRRVFGWDMPASWLQSVNPLLIILMAPLFGVLWERLGSRQPSIPVKFGMGLLLLAAGFVVLAWSASFAGEENKVSPMWLVATYFLHTSGELCLSPVGLSSITKLSPRPLVGQMMGIWFMGGALGNLMAGLMGGKFDTLPLWQLFGAVALIAAVAGAAFLLVSPWVKKLCGSVK